LVLITGSWSGDEEICPDVGAVAVAVVVVVVVEEEENFIK